MILVAAPQIFPSTKLILIYFVFWLLVLTFNSPIQTEQHEDAWSMLASLSLALDVANNSTQAGHQDPPVIWIQPATRDQQVTAICKPQSAARVGHESPANKAGLDCEFDQKACLISEMSSVIIRMAETEVSQIVSKVLWEIAYLCFFPHV